MINDMREMENGKTSLTVYQDTAKSLRLIKIKTDSKTIDEVIQRLLKKWRQQ